MGGALLAWSIAVAGSRRPGRVWPRLWAPVLAALMSLVAFELGDLVTEPETITTEQPSEQSSPLPAEQTGAAAPLDPSPVGTHLLTEWA